MDEYVMTSIDRLIHISRAVKNILGYCEGKSEEAFLADSLLQSAVLYQFLIIGEAIRFVDADMLRKYSYPWHLPKSFRKYIAHEYFGINLRRVYATVDGILPDFMVLVDRMIEEGS